MGRSSGPPPTVFFFFFLLAVLGFHCCTRGSSSCGEWGLILHCGAWASHCGGFSCCGAWALGVWASVAVARGLSSCGSWALECRLSSCGTWAQLLHRMWDLPGPGIEPMSPALAGGFLTTAPPGKSPPIGFELRVCAFLSTGQGKGWYSREGPTKPESGKLSFCTCLVEGHFLFTLSLCSNSFPRIFHRLKVCYEVRSLLFCTWKF